METKNATENRYLIAAIRAGYRAAQLLPGGSEHISEIARAWKSSDRAGCMTLLYGVVFELSAIEGAWDVWSALKVAVGRAQLEVA